MTHFHPLAGTRVLDLTREAAGQACARIFAQLGADVRRDEPEAVASLKGQAPDLVLSDLRRAELDAIGWSPESGPGVASIVSITPFGLDGPYAARDDVTLASGWLGQRASAALTAAHAAAVGLAVLRSARVTGQPLVGEVATYEVVASCLGDALPPAVCPLPPRPSSPRLRIAVAPCAGGFVGLAAPTPLDRAHLAALTGVPAVAAEDADLAALLSDWLATRTRLQVFEEAQLWRIPIVPVLSEVEALGGEPVVGSPFRASASPPPSPIKGEGTFLPPHLRGRVGQGGNQLPLNDIRILDLGMVWAGPYCGRLLAGLGAEVTKVEGPARRDGTRPPAGWEGCAGLYADLNRGKKSLVIDLAHNAGRDALLRVATDTDVVLDNFSPRVMPNLGLDHVALVAANPDIITLSMPAFRPGGPWGAFVAYGSGLELVSGLAKRGPDGRPEPAPVPYLDYLSGTYGAITVLGALIARDGLAPDSRPAGVHIEVAQHEVAAQLLADGLRCLPGDGSPFDPASLAHDPHLVARGLLPRAGASDCKHLLRLPWTLNGVAPAVECQAPGFGEDSREVLERARLAPTDVRALIRTGVVFAGDNPRSLGAAPSAPS